MPPVPLPGAEDFTVGRNNPLENVGSAELNSLFCAVASAFGPPWLNQPSGANRIQALWSRQDGLATNQSAVLGDALNRLTPLNPEWIAQRIKAIKSETAKNRKGDLFELLGLSLFALDGQKVTGAPEMNPGYDGTIDFGGGALGRISIKDFGPSSHRKLFEGHAARVEQDVVGALQGLRMTGLGLRIAATRFPLQADWEKLRRAVGTIISDWRTEWRTRHVGGIWTLTPQPPPTDGAQLGDGHLSYAIVVLSPHHSNEQRNVDSKIESACVNLSKHTSPQWADAARLLLIRVPESASPAQCMACAGQWLQARPEARVDSVIVYQPTVAAASTPGSSGIVHFIGIVTGPGFDRWRRTVGRPDLLIQARVLVGRCTNEPTKLLGTDGSLLGDQYIYQRGQIYTLSEAKADRTIVGNMTNPAPGIMVHTILRIPGQAGECVLSGKFPPDSELLLYS
jgi:hypothetical protein